ncbi:MAG: hypothetical protein JWO81_2832 [Alphaproteobacteria bacterium]|nr:hypothetical protein [Alphaproteobacteria bacterium]
MARTIHKVIGAALLASASASVAGGSAPGQSPARPGDLVLYEQVNYNGDDYTIDRNNTSIHTDWNVRSIAIHAGDKWEICNKPRFQGACLTLTESVPDASTIGVMGQVPSARRLVAQQ